MEPWQRNYIANHGPSLLKDTECSTQLIAELYSSGILSDEEKSRLNKNGQTDFEVNGVLYDLMKQKVNGYKTLVTSLYKTKQSGALRILVLGFFSQGILNPAIEKWNEILNICKIKLAELGKHVEESLMKLLKLDKSSLYVCNHVPPRISPYIPRTLTARRHLTPALFQAQCSDVFLVKNIGLAALGKLANGADFDRSSNQTEVLNVRFILLEHDSDFEKIKQLSSSPVHFIRYEDDQFVWVKSHGSVATIHQFVGDTAKEFPERIFTTECLQRNESVCIWDSPGMGKTALLINLARDIMFHHPERLVQFLVCREFIPKISNEVNKDSISTLIAEQTCEHSIGQEIVRKMLQSGETQCELFFDGFDEILPFQRETAKIMLQMIVDEFPHTRVYVTARPHMRQELEETLGVLGYNMLPFRDADQKKFLVKLWQESGAENEEKLGEFANMCLQTLTGMMNDFNGSIAGIPLICRLLGEVYLHKAINFGMGSANHYGLDVPIKSIHDLYETLVTSRLDEFLKDRKENVILNIKDSVLRTDVKQQVLKVHEYNAVNLIYPGSISSFMPRPTSVSESKLLSIGIHESTEGVDTTPRFIHRTFAEYFVGNFVVHMLNKDLDWYDMSKNKFQKFVNFLLGQVLATEEKQECAMPQCDFGNWGQITSYRFQQGVVGYFINACLQRYPISEESYEAVIGAIQKGTFSNKQFHQCLIASVVHNFPHIYDFLINCYKRQGSSGLSFISFPWPNCLLLAAKHANVDFMKNMLALAGSLENISKFAFPTSKSCELQLTPLYVAIQRGKLRMVTVCEETFGAKSVKSSLHICVTESAHQSGSVINHKIEIINHLVSNNGVKVNEKLEDGTTPIMSLDIHPKLVECLLQLEADTDCVDSQGNTPLHIAAASKNPLRDDVCRVLISSGAKLDVENCQGNTPLVHGFSVGSGLDVETLQLMEKHGLRMSSRLATHLFKVLVLNKQTTFEPNGNIVDVMDYLISKGASNKRFKRSWSSNQVKSEIKTVALAGTNSSPKFSAELEKRGLATDTNFSRRLSENRSSLEIVFTSLLACKMTNEFATLRQHIQADGDTSTIFLSGCPGMATLRKNLDARLVIVVSPDVNLTIKRLQDTVDRSINVVKIEDFKSDEKNLAQVSSDVVYISCDKMSKKFIENLVLWRSKVLCITTDETVIKTKLPENVYAVKEQFSWSDLLPRCSQTFQIQILSEMYTINDIVTQGLVTQQELASMSSSTLVNLMHDSVSTLTKLLDQSTLITKNTSNVPCLLTPNCTCGNHTTEWSSVIRNVAENTRTVSKPLACFLPVCTFAGEIDTLLASTCDSSEPVMDFITGVLTTDPFLKGILKRVVFKKMKKFDIFVNFELNKLATVRQLEGLLNKVGFQVWGLEHHDENTETKVGRDAYEFVNLVGNVLFGALNKVGVTRNSSEIPKCLIDLAMNTFSQVAPNIHITEIETYIASGLVKQNINEFKFVHDAFAYYIMALGAIEKDPRIDFEILKGDIFKFVNKQFSECGQVDFEHVTFWYMVNWLGKPLEDFLTTTFFHLDDTKSNKFYEICNNNSFFNMIKSSLTCYIHKIENLTAMGQSEIKDYLKFIAFNLLFKVKLSIVDNLSSEKLQHFASVGLLKYELGVGYIFAHKILAYFVVAQEILENIGWKNGVDKSVKHLFKTHKKYSQIFYGFEVLSNMFIHETFWSIFNVYVTPSNSEAIVELVFDCLLKPQMEQVIEACVTGNHMNVLQLLLKASPQAHEVFASKRIMWACLYHGNLEMIKFVSYLYTQQTSLPITSLMVQKQVDEKNMVIITPLHMALRYRPFNVVASLAEEYKHGKILNGTWMNDLTRSVVYNTVNCTDYEILERMQILRYLAKVCMHMGKSQMVQLSSTILAHVHVKLVEGLLQVSDIEQTGEFMYKTVERKTGYEGINDHLKCIAEMHPKLTDEIFKRFITDQEVAGGNFELSELVNAHVCTAVGMLFPNYKSLFEPSIVEMEALTSIGIIKRDESDGFTTFIHQTFAEYFVFVGVTNILGKPNYSDSFIDMVFHQLLSTTSNVEPFENIFNIQTYDFKYPVIAHYMNSSISEHLPKILSFVTPFTTSEDSLYQFLVAAVCHNFSDLFNLGLNVLKQTNNLSSISWNNLHHLSVQHAGIDLIKQVFDLTMSHEANFQPSIPIAINTQSFNLSSLHVAVERGNLELFTYLFKCDPYNHPVAYKYLLHYCVQNTVNQPNLVVCNKIKIVQYLFAVNGKCLEETLSSCTPLLCSRIHIELLKCLLELGASADVVDGKNQTVAHKAAQYLTPEDFATLVVFIQEKSQTCILEYKDAHQNTVLKLAESNMDIRDYTREVLKSVNTNELVESSGESTELVGDISSRLLSTIKDHGTDILIRGENIVANARCNLTNVAQIQGLNRKKAKLVSKARNLFNLR